MNWSEISGFFNIVFTLVIVFQWLDKRSKNKWLENTFYSLREMSERASLLSEKQAVRQKSDDLISVIDAAIRTIDGSKRRVNKNH